MLPPNPNPATGSLRCAIYTRKSSEEGLEQSFNSLDAQREAAHAYIASQQSEGWTALPQTYDDGGFTGGNLERPAMARLLADIEAGQIDCVVVYKVDRLSRSLLDFARIMGLFEQHGVSFVSVTQQFHTGTPVGRLTLHILLSFAQFEREIIRERTRDKKAAARRKGHWTGGYLPLGYDLVAGGGKLVANAGEAAQVQAIFEWLAQSRSVAVTLEQIRQRDWKTKRWITQKGVRHEGQVFNEASLLRLLRNPLYAGWMEQDGQLYRGEQPALVSDRRWKQVGEILRRLPPRTPKERNKQGALLKGILRCAGCDRAMAVTCAGTGERRYRYYVCRSRNGGEARPCSGRYVGAEVLEQSVIEQLRLGSGGARLRQLVQTYANRSSTGAGELIARMRSVVETIAYDGETGEVTIRLSNQRKQGHGPRPE